MSDTLRWLLVLPASIGSHIGIQLLVALSSEQLPLPDVAQDWYSQAMNSVAAPWALVYAGSRVSPRGRRLATSIVLAVLIGVLMGAVAVLSLVSTATAQAPLWWLWVSGAAGLGAAVVACIQIQREEQQLPNLDEAPSSGPPPASAHASS